MSNTLHPRLMRAKDITAIEKFMQENPDKIKKLPAGIASGAVMSIRAKEHVKKRCKESRQDLAKRSDIPESEIPF